MKSINYTIILIIITIINLLIVSTQYTIIIDTNSSSPYDDFECGDIEGVPCQTIHDAGERARNLNKSITSEITFQFQNQFYQLENENSTFGNLYGYTLITFTNGLGIENNPIIFDGTKFSNETTPFLSIILDDDIVDDDLEIQNSLLIEISNVTFQNFKQKTTIFRFQSNTTLGSPLNLIQIFNSTFSKVESTIVNSRQFIKQNSGSGSDSSNGDSSQQSTTIIFSSCSFSNVNQVTSIPFILYDSKLQLLESTIVNSFITHLPFIEIDSGSLRIFSCTFNSITSNNVNNNITFISLNNSGINTQIESITITNSSISRFIKSNQSTPTIQYQPNYQYTLFSDINIINNNFKITSTSGGDGSGSGSSSIEQLTNSNIGFIQLISNGRDLNFTQVLSIFMIQSNTISSIGNGSSGSGSSGDIDNLHLTLLSIEGGGIYSFDNLQFKDVGDGFYDLNLINTNVTIENSEFFSNIPIIGSSSNVHTDSLTYFNSKSFYKCVDCPINNVIYSSSSSSNGDGSNDGYFTRNKTAISVLVSIGGVVLIGSIIFAYKIFYRRKLDRALKSYKTKQGEDEEKYIDIADDHPSAESHLPLLYHHDDNPRADVHVNDSNSEFQVAGDVDNLYYQTFKQ